MPLTEKQWYVIRVAYGRELKVKDELDGLEVENFIPMRYKYSIVKGKRTKQLVPVIHNLIFIHCTTQYMKEYKAITRLPIRYIMDKEHNTPIVIPENQMRDFILVSGTNDENLLYNAEADMPECVTGETVKVIGGIFEGVTGTVVRVEGKKRVMVSINGFMTVMTASIRAAFLEKVNSNLI